MEEEIKQPKKRIIFRKVIVVAIFRTKKLFLWPLHFAIRRFFYNEWIILDLELARRQEKRRLKRQIMIRKKNEIESKK